LKKANKKATIIIDKILHRNRAILLELLGKYKKKLKISRLILDDRNFKYDYITGFHINKHKKMVHHVYDFAWLIFSDDTIFIFRK